MCELFALSGLCPANVRLFLPKFAAHGGEAGPHVDGWGIAFYEGNAALVIREAAPASNSAMARFMANQTTLSTTVISHIRKATGNTAVALRNTQPFVRELAGHDHVFAHNGNVPGVLSRREFPLKNFHPVGETDSEHAFCYLLDRLHPLWDGGTPPVEERVEVIREMADRLARLGPFNFLYGDGEYLYAYSHKRLHDNKPPPRPPGLHWLHRVCEGDAPQTQAECLHIRSSETTGEQRVILLASVPLTDEPWQPMEEGSLLVLRNGTILSIDGKG
ncbi:MAG: class II glutamine amidotransferase [Deltaproteobacteria bacterium]|nr:class II glutamine amidotransferase [Deltaproteobacteria bacterium]